VAVLSVVVLIDGATFTVMVSDLVAEAPFTSVTFTVKVWEVAPAPTVPPMVPLEAPMVRPLGSVPDEIDQV